MSPIEQCGKTLFVALDTDSHQCGPCDLISLNPALDHLDNIGSSLKDFSGSTELQIDINLGDVPPVTQLLMCYKLEQYLETTSQWNFNMDRVTITLRNKQCTQVRWDSSFKTRVTKALGVAGRMMCGTQDVSESFAQEFEVDIESIPRLAESSSQVVWRYTVMKNGSSGQGGCGSM